MPTNEEIESYRKGLLAALPFMLQRRFVAAESWTKDTTEDGTTRYLDVFRDHEPGLATISTQRALLLLGDLCAL